MSCSSAHTQTWPFSRTTSPPPVSASFNEFQESAADAWGDDADDGLSKVQYHRSNSVSGSSGGAGGVSASSGSSSKGSTRSSSPVKAGPGARAAGGMMSPSKKAGITSPQKAAGRMHRRMSSGGSGGTAASSDSRPRASTSPPGGAVDDDGAAQRAKGARIEKFKALIASPNLDLGKLNSLLRCPSALQCDNV